MARAGIDELARNQTASLFMIRPDDRHTLTERAVESDNWPMDGGPVVGRMLGVGRMMMPSIMCRWSMSMYSLSPLSVSAVEQSRVLRSRAANSRCRCAVSVEKNGWAMVA